jgi:hypothetical protein
MGTSQRNHLWLLPVVYYLGFLLILISYWFAYALDHEWHREWLQGEDRLGELLTFVAFFLAFVFMVFLLKDFWRKMNKWTRVYFVGITLFFFMCAGEEISWAQRVFGFATPASMLEKNEQEEFNLHNLDYEHFHPADVASIFMQFFGIVLPVLACRSMFRSDGRWRRFVAPLYMVPCFVFAQALNAAQSRIKPWLAEQFGTSLAVMVRTDTRELTEMFWGICVMLTACALYAAWEQYKPGLDAQ